MPHWLRILLSAIAGAIGGWFGMIAVGGGAAGFGWIFLFGDDPWPKWGEVLIVVLAAAGAIGGAALIGLAAWRATGKYWS